MVGQTVDFLHLVMAARFTPVEASERNKEVTLGDLERHQDLGSTKSTIQTGI